MVHPHLELNMQFWMCHLQKNVVAKGKGMEWGTKDDLGCGMAFVCVENEEAGTP